MPDAPSGDGVLVLAGPSGRVDPDRARVFASNGSTAESIKWFGGQDSIAARGRSRWKPSSGASTS